MPMFFRNRAEAGHRLCERLKYLQGTDLVVLGLPRGGVPVAFWVAWALDAPLDVLIVGKLGVPFQPELAMGAIGEHGVRVIDAATVRAAQVTPVELGAIEQRERLQLARRVRAFRADQPAIPLAGRTALVVDDGIATGATARTACQVVRKLGAARVVFACPVASPRAIDDLEKLADEVVCLTTPPPFFGIGQFYADFTQTTDAEVTELLHRANLAAPSAATPTVTTPAKEQGRGPMALDEDVTIKAGRLRLAGHLTVPKDAAGIVVFAYGSGSSRHSPRNRLVAGALNDTGVGTLLFDLLTATEELRRSNVLDVPLLSSRLVEATRWLRGRPEGHDVRIGYFGASTGTAAALWAAAELGSQVAAVVSRGGRPDLAAPILPSVRAPTLLIVGGADQLVLDLNYGAKQRLRCECALHVVPGATHLFEEPGALESVADEAAQWFLAHLSKAR